MDFKLHFTLLVKGGLFVSKANSKVDKQQEAWVSEGGKEDLCFLPNSG